MARGAERQLSLYKSNWGFASTPTPSPALFSEPFPGNLREQGFSAHLPWAKIQQPSVKRRAVEQLVLPQQSATLVKQRCTHATWHMHVPITIARHYRSRGAASHVRCGVLWLGSYASHSKLGRTRDCTWSEHAGAPQRLFCPRTCWGKAGSVSALPC